MKKLLGISLVAVLTAMPLMAGAATGDAVNAVPTTDANGPTTVAPKYATVADIAADATSLATAKYVKGAYNAAIKAINTVDTNYKAADTAINDKIGNTALTTENKTLTGAIEEIKSANATSAGAGIDKTNGKFSVDLATNSGLETSGEGDAAKLQIADGGVTATKLASDSVTTAKIVDANVTKAKLDAGVQASLDAADSALQASDLATYATQAGVLATIGDATASVTGVSLGVAGGVTGNVPAMVNWGDETAGSVALANGAIANGATATGDITGIDVAVPDRYNDGENE